MECAFQTNSTICQLFIILRPPGNGLMSQWASLLTVCWKLFAKRLQSPQPTEWKIGRTKLISASEIGLVFCGWISVFNLETVPSLKYWLLARMCHRGLPRLKLNVENSCILFYFHNQKTSRWQATWGSLWWPSWRREAAGSWCRQWWWPGSGINKWLERNGEIVLLILINILSLPWPASLIPSCSAE